MDRRRHVEKNVNLGHPPEKTKTRFRDRLWSKLLKVLQRPSSEKPIPRRRQGGNKLSRPDTGTGNRSTSSYIPTSRRRWPPADSSLSSLRPVPCLRAESRRQCLKTTAA